jgi:hypothetical protein
VERVRSIEILHFGCILMLVAIAIPASPCDRASEISGEVRHHFEVEVQDPNRKSVAGVKVELEREIEKEPYYQPVRSGLTGRNGRVSFSGVASGRYLLSYSYLQIGDAPVLVVGDSAEANAVVGVQRPSRDIVKVQSIAGTFNARFYQDTGRGVSDIAYKQEGPFSNETIALTSANLGKAVGTTSTDDHGHFAFGSVEPGLYILQVHEPEGKKKTGMEIEGDIFIEVASDATDRELPTLQLNESSCGLSYTRMEPDAPIMH